MNANNTIQFDKPMRERLRKAYLAAKTAGMAIFEFDGKEYVTSFAKYLLEHLDNQLGK